MVKRNIIGLLWLYASHGLYILLALLGLYFFSSQALWDIDDLFLKILSILEAGNIRLTQEQFNNNGLLWLTG